MTQIKIKMRLFLLIAGFLLIGLFGAAVAQNETLPAKEPLPELPNPGQKPGDLFYFLDQWIEAFGEFFTFNPEARALLQTERALERIAEVKALLEIKGVDAPGLDVAQEKIQANMAKASQIIEAQKAKGKDIAKLAQKLDDEFDVRQELLKQTLKAEKAKLKAQKEEIKLQILQARQAGDFKKVGRLGVTLTEIETQKENFEQKWEAQKEQLDLEEEKLEAELEAKEKELEELEEREEDLLEEKERRMEQEEESEWLKKLEEELEEKEQEELEKFQEVEEEEFEKAREEALEEREEQQVQGVWKLERILRSSGVEVDKEQEVKYEEYLSFKGNKVCGAGVRDVCILDYVSFAMEGEKIVPSRIIGLLGVEIEKIYFRNNKIEYQGFTEKGDTIKHFYGKISSVPLEER